MKRLAINRRQLLVGGTTFATAAMFSAPAWASYPDRVITLVVPFPAGGASDIVGRAVARGLSQRLGQQVVVDNKGGAGGQLGAGVVARAKPDGYTLLLASNSHVVNQTLNPSQPYHSLKDFTPLGMISFGPLVLVVNPQRVKANTFKEFLAEARAKPGKLTYGSGGSGTLTHLAPELLKSEQKLFMVHVPYRGLAPAVQDLIGGRTDFMFDTLSDSLSFIKAGRLKALAVTSEQRNIALPLVPTMTETLPRFTAVAWQALLAPANLPPDIAQRLRQELATVRSSPEMQAVLEGTGSLPSKLPTSMTAEFLKDELERWGAVVKRSGATAD